MVVVVVPCRRISGNVMEGLKKLFDNPVVIFGNIELDDYRKLRDVMEPFVEVLKKSILEDEVYLVVGGSAAIVTYTYAVLKMLGKKVRLIVYEKKAGGYIIIDCE